MDRHLKDAIIGILFLLSVLFFMFCVSQKSEATTDPNLIAFMIQVGLDPNTLIEEPEEPNLKEIDYGLWQVIEASKKPPEPNLPIIRRKFDIIRIPIQTGPIDRLSLMDIKMIEWYEENQGELFLYEIIRRWLEDGPTDLNKDHITNYIDIQWYTDYINKRSRIEWR